MPDSIGRGPFGSLAHQVDHEIRQLARSNPTLRQVRYSWPRRLLRIAFIDRSVRQFVDLYLAFMAICLFAQWAIGHYKPTLLPVIPEEFGGGVLKDIASYLISAEVGMLAIVSVAVGVVTLLSDRGYGASINTDIRLYYVESYSYELAVSGVSLLLVLIVQLFWPFHHLLAAFALGGPEGWCELALTVFHAAWLWINVLLFLQFITTTLRFVEPHRREGLREQYSANEVIPRDVRDRFLKALYLTAPTQSFGKDALRDGPSISCGYASGLDDPYVPEVSMSFRRPHRLVDVRWRLLRWVVLRWRRRVLLNSGGHAQPGQRRENYHLSFLPNFDGVIEGTQSIVLRQGDVACDRLERWILRRCFRFACATTRADDMPTPSLFLGQLVDKLVQQIEQGSTTGFKAALDEVSKYHRFILMAQNTRGDDGMPFNFSEIGGTFFSSRPDADWIHQYRRAFAAAVEKIGSDRYFINRLSHLAIRLVPNDGLNFSHRVFQTILTLGQHEVAMLEDWVTRRAVIGAATEHGQSASLTGSDKRAYEDALIGFVEGWEALLQTLVASMFKREMRFSATQPATRWEAFSKAFPVFQTHLHFCAYFFAAAVWNDDALGADRFRDLLLRWLHPFYSDLQDPYVLSPTALVMPDWTERHWATVETEAGQLVPFRYPTMTPGTISGVLLAEAHYDIVCLSGLVVLYWHTTNQQPSSVAADAARLCLNRTNRSGDGSDLTEMARKSVFRSLIDFFVRYASNPRFAEGRYSATLDGVVQLLTNLSSRRMVSGRIYGGFGIEGVDTLRPVLLAAMASYLPTEGADDGLPALAKALEGSPQLAEDKNLRNFIWTFNQLTRHLGEAEVDETYKNAAAAIDPTVDLPAATARLKVILSDFVNSFEKLREERLRAAPLDDKRLDQVRRYLSGFVLAHGPGIACWRHCTVVLKDDHPAPVTEAEFGVVPKGSFTVPEMSLGSFENLPPMFAGILQDLLAGALWASLYNRPKQVVEVDINASNSALWRGALDGASGVGPEPILLVPFGGVGDQLSMASITGNLDGFSITDAKPLPSGGGTGFLGYLETLPVYSCRALSNEAILCSSRLLRAVRYGVVYGGNDLVDITLVEGEDLEKCKVRLRFSQDLDWGDDVFIEFHLLRPIEEEPPVEV